MEIFFLDEFSTHDSLKDQQAFWKSQDGHLVSGYPIGTALVATPLYILPVLTGWIDEPDHLLGLSRGIAFLLTSVFTVLVFVMSCRWLPLLPSAAIAFLSFFGTNIWSIASQDLWQHGLASLLLLSALMLLFAHPRTPRSLFFLGLALGGAVITRYSTVVFLAPFLAVVAWRERSKIFWVILGGSIPAAIFLTYTVMIFGWPVHNGLLYGNNMWVGPSFDRIFGIWVSPSRGLLWFSPFIIFSLLGLFIAWKRTRIVRERDALSVIIAVLVASTLLYGSWYSWEGAGAFGPRMTIETIPFLMLGLILGIRYGLLHSTYAQVIFLLCVVFSVTTHFLGATQFNYEWHAFIGQRDVEPWLFRDGQLWFFYSRML